MLKRNLVANYFGQGWIALLGFAFVPLYIRYLGIEAYGLIGLFAVLQACFAVLDLGMAPTLSREMGRFTGGGLSADSVRDLLRSVELVAAIVACIVAWAIFLSSDWLANVWLKAEHLPSTTVAQALSIMGFITALQFFNGIYRSCLIGLQQQVRLNQINSAMATLQALGAIAVLAWLSQTLQAFFVWQMIVSVLSLIILAATSYSYLPLMGRAGRFSLIALKGIGRYAGGMAGITILSIMLTQIDKVLLSSLLTLSEFGYYTVAALVAMGLRLLMAPIALAWYPRMSQLHAENDTSRFIAVYHEGAQLVCVIMGTGAVILIMFSETILYLWTQDIELSRASSTLVKWLAVGNLLNGFMTIPYYAQLAYGWTGYALRVNAISVVLIVPSLFWAVPKYGALGASYVWVALNAGYVLVGVHFMYRRMLTTEKWRWYWDDIIRPMFLAVAMAIFLSVTFPASKTLLGQVSCIVTATMLVLLAAVFGASRIKTRAKVVLLSLRRKAIS